MDSYEQEIFVTPVRKYKFKYTPTMDPNKPEFSFWYPVALAILVGVVFTFGKSVASRLREERIQTI
jgi:hypothetical protein